MAKTVRQMIEALLRGGSPKTLLEIAMGVRIREREVVEHLEHLKKSGKAKGVQIEMEPARCLDCDFVFKKRDKLTNPSRCPVCGSERVSHVRFQIVD